MTKWLIVPPILGIVALLGVVWATTGLTGVAIGITTTAFTLAACVSLAWALEHS